jgi:NAD(P)-dependent dehydrogenase (short-subunit alcohol dehydrogenase family)
MGILDGKVAIVSGAGKGCGKGEALALAKEGAKVTVLARTLSDVEQTAKEIERVGGEALAVRCDVCDVDQVNEVVRSTVQRFGTVDILVNNAQIVYPRHPVEDWTLEEMRSTYESGVLGSWAFMVACLPHMKAASGGRIINFCSAAGHGIAPGYVGYAAAKEGIRALTRTAAREWGKHKITVNVISPAALSDAIDTLFPTPEDKAQCLRDLGAAIFEFGDAEADIGRAVVYLAGPDARVITGCTLSVDCGVAML